MSNSNMQRTALDVEAAALSRDPYGHDFAERVWQRLVALGSLYRKHRDYCGIGLVYDPTSGVSAIVVVHDAGPVSNLLEFGHKEAFVDFLARQSDFTLAGTDDGPKELRAEAPRYVNNQRLDRAFLMGEDRLGRPIGGDA
jgi:hypothetical protein